MPARAAEPVVDPFLDVQDAVGGIVDFVIVAAPVARTLAAGGKLRPIAITSLKRMPEYADVPAIAETYPGFDFTGWQFLAAPAGTPAIVIDRMNREVNAVLTTLTRRATR